MVPTWPKAIKPGTGLVWDVAEKMKVLESHVALCSQGADVGEEKGKWPG